MDSLRRSRTPTTVLSRDSESANKRGRTSFVHDFDLFVTVRLLGETPAVLLLDMLCSKQRYSFEWKNGKIHDWPHMGCQLLVQRTTSYFLPYQDCHLFQQQFVFNIEINGSVKLFQKIGTIIRTSHDPKWQACMRETDADRSWQAGHGKPWTSIRFFQTRCARRIQRKAFPIGYAHSSEREISEAEGDASKVVTQKWKHSIHTHFRKYRKRSIPRTEETGDLTTVERKSESRNNNQQFAAVVQDLTTQWILPVWNQNFSGDGEEFHESFQSRHRSQKLLKRTIYWNLESRVKNYHGIIEQLHLVAQKQAKLQNELYVE